LSEGIVLPEGFEHSNLVGEIFINKMLTSKPNFKLPSLVIGFLVSCGVTRGMVLFKENPTTAVSQKVLILDSSDLVDSSSSNPDPSPFTYSWFNAWVFPTG